MADYYISKSGLDTNGGTSSEDAWLTHAHAATQITVGGTVHVGPGAYEEDNIYCNANAGETVVFSVEGSASINFLSNATTELISGKQGFFEFSGYTIDNSYSIAAEICEILNDADDNGVTFRDCQIDYNGADWFPFHLNATTGLGDSYIRMIGGSMTGVTSSRGICRDNKVNGTHEFTMSGVDLGETAGRLFIGNRAGTTVSITGCSGGAINYNEAISLVGAVTSLTVQGNDFSLETNCKGIINGDTASLADLEANPSKLSGGHNIIRKDPTDLTLGIGGTATNWERLWCYNTDYNIPPQVTDKYFPTGYAVESGKQFACLGDSIVYGNAATDYLTNDNNAWAGLISSGSGLSRASRDIAAMGGIKSSGAHWRADFIAACSTDVRTVFVSVGINDILQSKSNASIVAYVTMIFDKLINYGMEPVWLGIGPANGDETTVDTVNALIEAVCLAKGIRYTNWRTAMSDATASWATTYYADYASNVHPNDTGHALIASVALEAVSTPVMAIRCKPVRCFSVMCEPVTTYHI